MNSSIAENVNRESHDAAKSGVEELNRVVLIVVSLCILTGYIEPATAAGRQATPEEELNVIMRQLATTTFKQLFEVLDLPEQRQESFIELMATTSTITGAITYQTLSVEVRLDVERRWRVDYEKAMREILGDGYSLFQPFVDSLTERRIVNSMSNALEFPLSEATREELILLVAEEFKAANCSILFLHEETDEERTAYNAEKQTCLESRNSKILDRSSPMLTPAQLGILQSFLHPVTAAN